MICRASFAAFAWLIASTAALAAGMDCPTQGYDKIESLLAAAPSCDASMNLLLACQLGSSGDVGFALIVIKKCEAGFLPSLSKRARRIYERKVGACWRRFANEGGTLFQSIRAVCAAELARAYALRAARNKTR